jgi:hypothetical protein
LVNNLCHPRDYHSMPVRICLPRWRSWGSFARSGAFCYSPNRRIAHLRMRIAIAFKVVHILLALTLMAVASLRVLYRLT